ncbi:30S ribosomal protein S15, partial [Frankliniella fusca]
MPWTWLYNRSKNTGKIANIVQNLQRHQKEKRARGGGSDNRKKGPKPVENIVLNETISDAELSKDAAFLRYVVDTDNARNDIEAKMKTTFKERRDLIESGKYNTHAILRAFPKLMSFKGSMIDFEFKLLKDGKEHNFLLNWREVSRKIAAAGRKNKKLESCFQFKDDALNAMYVLAKYLPRARRVYQWENEMNPDPIISDFIQVEP